MVFQKRTWLKGLSLLLCAVLLLPFLNACGSGPDDCAPEPDASAALPTTELRTAVYPEMPPFPASFEDREGFENWRKAVEAQDREEGYADGLEPFWEKSMQTFLGTDVQDNKVCSPMNIYLALGMLAEVTGGDSRQEILNLLGQPDTESLRAQASDVWNAQYQDDKAVTMVLANSLWLNENLKLKEEPLSVLADHYYASSFSGTPGSPEMDQALRTWLSKETAGLLDAQAEGVSLDPETILSLASAIRYQVKWEKEFEKSLTAPREFKGSSGTVTRDFLHRLDTGTFYWASQFSAVALNAKNNGGSMVLLLPDPEMTPEQLLKDPETFQFLRSPWDWSRQKVVKIDFAMPKFDIASDLDLSSGLQAMGISQVFTKEADFTPLTDQQALLSGCSHAARVAVDEEGITAAAYTILEMAGCAEPPEEIAPFILDRPFLFVLQSPDGLPLFAGIVNHP